MKVKMLSDFRGRETKEQYYTKGEVIDLPGGIAQALISLGRAESAEVVEESKPDEKLISTMDDSGRRKRNGKRN
jgi:hypothetical protein